MAVRQAEDKGNGADGILVNTDLPDSIGISEAEFDLLEPYLMDIVADMLNTPDTISD
ncbi:MAG: hypothetical protein ISR47_00335 [Rhodospirillales bacterium]|nr:hypothetical protein [Rhodospirillales bacterium]